MGSNRWVPAWNHACSILEPISWNHLGSLKLRLNLGPLAPGEFSYGVGGLPLAAAEGLRRRPVPIWGVVFFWGPLHFCLWITFKATKKRGPLKKRQTFGGLSWGSYSGRF